MIVEKKKMMMIKIVKLYYKWIIICKILYEILLIQNIFQLSSEIDCKMFFIDDFLCKIIYGILNIL